MPVVTIPIAEYTPDMPALNNPGSGSIVNCVPRSANSYGPFASLQVYGSALTARCQGAYTCIDSSGNANLFAGDATKLYRYTASSTTADDVSNGTYTISGEERWNFTLFGQRVVATDFSDAMQSFVLGTSTDFADLANGGITALTLVGGSGYTNGTFALTVTGGGSGTGFTGTVTVTGGSLASYAITNTGHGYPQTATISIPAGAGAGVGGSITPSIAYIAPKARYIGVVKGFLVVGNTNDAVSNAQPQRVWWSGLNDPTSWPTPGTATAAQFQSSYNDLFGDSGWIKGIVGNLGTADGAVFMEHAIWRMVYVGAPAVFNFFQAEGVRGTQAPGSIAQLGGTAFYFGEDGFYSFDGTSSIPIGFDKVDKTVLADLDTTYIDRMTGAIDPINKLYLCAYAGAGNVVGNPNRLLAYHWPTRKWSLINEDTEIIVRALTFGNNVLDTVGAVSLDTAFYNTFPMDSRVWIGGNIIMAAFDTAHKLSYFNGANMEAVIDTTELEPFQGQLAFIQDCRPQVDGSIPMVSFGVRNRLIDPVTFNSPVAINSIGTCPQTVNGRYVRGEITIPSGDWTHAQGLQVEGIPNGVM